MAKKHGTAIEWTHAEGYKGETWNPVTGCSKVSPGCAHCYAEREALGRLRGKHGYPGLPWTPANAPANVILHPDRLDQPLRWRKPRMIFVNSMSDLFHEQIPDDYIAECFGVMANADAHVFQVLTKRPDRMAELLSSPAWWADARFYAANAAVEIGSSPECPYLTVTQLDRIEADRALPNVWLGVSIENRRFVHRADVLRQTPAAVRFISAEPLLGPLICERCQGHGWFWGHDGTGIECTACDGDSPRSPKMLDLAGIDWLICGGESGPRHRSMRIEWARDLRDAAAANGTAFFFKQWGGVRPKAGGRELDGRTWDELPAQRPGFVDGSARRTQTGLGRVTGAVAPSKPQQVTR